LDEYTRKLEKAKLEKEMLSASNDPLFIKEIEDSMKAFEVSNRKAAKGISE